MGGISSGRGKNKGGRQGGERCFGGGDRARRLRRVLDGKAAVGATPESDSCLTAGGENVRNDFDLIIVGGGLSGSLLAYRLRSKRPHWRVLLIEGEKTLGGRHTWSFHQGDLSPRAEAWVRPL